MNQDTMEMGQIHNENLELELDGFLERRWEAHDEAAQKAIDEEVWSRFGGNWSVMYTDLSGFSRNAYRHGIMYTLGIIYAFRKIALPIIEMNEGLLMKTEGDSLMLLFPTVQLALKSALDIDYQLHVFNGQREDPKIYNACGIGYGRILKLGDRELYGVEVNLASKLGEDIGQGREILLTEAAWLQLTDRENIEADPFIMDSVLGLKAYKLKEAVYPEIEKGAVTETVSNMEAEYFSPSF